MNEANGYWIGGQPLDGDQWSYTDFGTVLDDAQTRQTLFRMYERYVRQWNDIELDHSRNLSEHTHQVHGAKVLAGDGRFVLHGRPNSRSHWILEIVFSGGFRVFHRCDLGRNTLRSTADMQSIHLHWSGCGREGFEHWMGKEQAITHGRAPKRSIRPDGKSSPAVDAFSRGFAEAVQCPWPIRWADVWRSRKWGFHLPLQRHPDANGTPTGCPWP
ncbi:hypothetical protein [Variovorax sp. Root411]|uniref:hypothetical protein n=1 Tax=Variovorax sp. Root411 TaxID=1736530 RepID=UPI0007013D39|nr:hypothetical protein [Variovorax sp. Root411]KQW64893.1 hypothetical protein ASC92_05540 [Variovorax sp. Root411]